MNKNRKIILVFLLFIFLGLAIWIFLKNSNISFKKNYNSEEKKIQKDFFSENNFEDRERIISRNLAKSFNVNEEKVSILIAQENNNHVAGLYFIGVSEGETNSGKFFGTIDDSVEIVWYGANNPDCDILLKNNFPQEMISGCF